MTATAVPAAWLLLLTVAAAQQPTKPEQVILPTEVVSPLPTATPTTAGGGVVTPGQTPVAGPAPAVECAAPDEFIKNQFSGFFLLTRLVDTFTLTNEPPSPPLNASDLPLTILVPSQQATTEFLRQIRFDIGNLANSPLESVLLAPTLAAHFVRGYYPSSALPTAPVDTLCGSACGALTFEHTQPVHASFADHPRANATITAPDLLDCPGKFVVHGVDSYLFNNVTETSQAAQPALNLAYALGGQWNTYNLVASTGGGRRRN